MSRTPTPLGAVVHGAMAGGAGTAAMDLALYLRYRVSSDDQGFLGWEFGGPSAWDRISAPGQVGRRLVEGFRQRALDERWARLTNNVTHWGYGIAWGGVLGLLAGSTPRSRHAMVGPLFGATVWGSSYVTLPVAGLYKPIWEYGPGELAPDLIAHLIFGVTAHRALRWLGGSAGS